jgi:hypothetical protein
MYGRNSALNLMCQDSYPDRPCWVILVREDIHTHSGYPDDTGGTVKREKIRWTDEEHVWRAAVEEIERDNDGRDASRKTQYMAFHMDKVAKVERVVSVVIS